MEFNIISNRSLSARINGIINTAEARLENYWNVLFNCVNRCYEHNDVSWVNKGLEAARAEGRYRATVAILKEVVPFKFSQAEGFHGKRSIGRHNKLVDKYAEVLMALITQQKEADTKAKEKKSEYDFYKALENFLKKAHKNDVSDAEVIEAIRELQKQAA